MAYLKRNFGTITERTSLSPTLTTPALGTASAGVVTNFSGVLPSGVTGGSGLTALGTVTAGTLSSGVTNNAGPWTKIGEASFSSAALFELGQDLGSYRVHKLFMTCHAPAYTPAVYILCVFKVGGSWITTGGAYSYTYFGTNSSGTSLAAIGSESNNFWHLARDGVRHDSNHAFEVTFHNMIPSGSMDHTTTHCAATGSNHDAAGRVMETGAVCRFGNVGTVQDIRIYPDGGGDRLTGEWELYGIS